MQQTFKERNHDGFENHSCLESVKGNMTSSAGQGITIIRHEHLNPSLRPRLDVLTRGLRAIRAEIERLDKRLAEIPNPPRFLLSERAQLQKRLEVESEYFEMAKIEDEKIPKAPPINKKVPRKAGAKAVGPLTEEDMKVFEVIKQSDAEGGWNAAKIAKILETPGSEYEARMKVLGAIHRLEAAELAYRTGPSLYRPRRTKATVEDKAPVA